jgi:hypothetical protein
MAINQQNYAVTPRNAAAVLSVANPNRDGTGTIVTAFPAGASGSRADRIVLKATGPTTPGMIRIYIHDGTNARLIDEVEVSAVTPSAIVEAWKTAFDIPYGIPLPASYSIRASTEKGETFNMFVFGGDF